MAKNSKTLAPEQVEWVVNDFGELGVRISSGFHWLAYQVKRWRLNWRT